MSTQSDALYSSFSQIHRAIVQYSSTTTGEIQVIIPSVTGNDTTVPISFFGRKEHPFENDWVVPNIGDTIIVCREDEDYTNTFWINTTYNPVRADVGESNPSNYNFGPAGSVSAFDLIDFGSTPTSSGLYLGSVNMGYYNHTASEWRTYMDYTGNFYLKGSGTNTLTWDGSTLAVTGTVTATDGEIGGWTIDADSLFSGTKDTSGYADGGGITISSGGSIHAKQFYIDTSGNAFFKGDLTGANITGTTGTFTGSITGASGTFTGSITGASGTFTGSITGASGTFGGTVSGATISGNTISGNTISGNTITGGSITTGDITITGLGSAGIDIGGTDATSWHMDADGNQWWGTSGTYGSADYRIANWGGAYLLYARIGGAEEDQSQPEDSKAWEINAGNITNVSTHNSIAATDGIAIGLNSVYGIFRAAGGRIIARGYSGGDIRMGIAQTTTDQPEYNTVGDIVMSKVSDNIQFSVEQALTVDNGVVTIASPSLTGNPTAPTQSSGNNSTRIATTAYVDAAGGSGTVTSVATTGAITGGTITTTGTIAHSTAAGYKHIPSGGSADQFLKYSSSGTAVWAADNDTVYTHPTSAGNKHIPSGGSADQFLKYSSSGTATWAAAPADATKLPLTGGTLSGDLTFSGYNSIKSAFSLYLNTNTNTNHITCYNNGDTRIKSSGVNKINAGNNVGFYANGQPTSNNTYRWGASNLAFNAVYSYSYPSISDVNQKTDIQDAVLGLEFVNGLRPVTFKWKETADENTHEVRAGLRDHYGFIAQEVEELLGPSASTTGLWIDGYSPLMEATNEDDSDIPESYNPGLRYDEFIPILTKALQEISNKLDAAEARIAVLETA